MFLKNVRANSVYTMTYVIYIRTSLQYVALSFLTTWCRWFSNDRLKRLTTWH